MTATKLEKGLAAMLAKETVKSAKLLNALRLITEVHPIRNSHEVYVEAVREIANEAIKEAEKK